MPYVTKQNYPIPFTKGVDTKTDPKQVLAGNLLTLQNARFNNPGEIEKRTGFSKFSRILAGSGGAYSITSGQALQDFNNELLLFDNTNVYSYIQPDGYWLNKGVAISIILEETKITRMNSAQQLNPDMSYLSGIEVYAYEDSRNSGGVNYVIRDNITGNIIVPDSVIQGHAQKPKVIPYNGKMYIFYTGGTGGKTLYYVQVDPTNPTTITSPHTVLTDGYAAFSYDIAVVDGYMYIAYLSTNTASGSIDVYYYDGTTLSSRTTVATGTDATTGAQFAINVVGDSGKNIWVSWANAVTVQTSLYTEHMAAQTFAPVIVDTVICTTLTGIESPVLTRLVLAYEVYDAVSYNESTSTAGIDNFGTVDLGLQQLSVGLASKSFKIGGNIYVNCAYDSSSTSTNLQCTYFTVLIYSNALPTLVPTQGYYFTVIGKSLPGVGGGLRSNGMLPEINTTSTNIFKWANLVKSPVISEGGNIFTLLGVNSTQMDLENPNKYIAAQFSNNLLIVGGILQIYDGRAVTEQGYHYYPEGITCTPTGSDGFLSTGTYSYCACYAWTDNFGQIHRSAPSPIVVVSVTALNHVSVTVPTYRLTTKMGSAAGQGTTVIIEIYRTQVNAAGLNPIFNLVTSTLAPEINSVIINSITFVDKESDVNAATNPPLYTTGGIIPNDAAPANTMMTVYNNRIILGGLEDPNTLWYSQNRTEIDNFNTTPVEFCAVNTIGVDPRGGPITALGLLNQNLIIFKKSQMYFINGSGPDNTGQGALFPDAQQIASDVGCDNPNSVVITPAGLMFQSDKGIYLLGTGLSYPVYIGAPVQGLLTNNTITSSTLSADKNLVIFTTASDNTMIYDYFLGQWSTDTAQPAIDSVIFEDLFTYITADGYVYQNNESIYIDDTAPIYLSFTTPWLSFAQLNGYQRVFRAYILGTYEGTHTLDVTVAYDYNTSTTYTTTITPSSTPPYEFRVDFNQQKCTAIQLTITDHQTSGYNQGYAISAITFVVGVMPGAVRLPAANQYGTS